MRLTRFSHGAGCACKLRPPTCAPCSAWCAASTHGAARPRPARRARHRRRRRRVPAPRRSRDRRHHRLLHPDRRRPVRLGPHRGHQRAVRRLRDGRRAAARAQPGGVAARGLCRSSCSPACSTAAPTSCGRAGALVAGGHSIDDAEPKYGLAVVGTVDPARVLTNAGARRRRRARADQADRARRDLDRASSATPRRPELLDEAVRVMTDAQRRRPRRRARARRRRARRDRRHRLRPARPPARAARRLRRRGRARRRRGARDRRACASCSPTGMVAGGTQRNHAFVERHRRLGRAPRGRSSCSSPTRRPRAGCCSPSIRPLARPISSTRSDGTRRSPPR